MSSLDFKTSAQRWQRYGEEYLAEGRNYYFQIINLSIQISIFLLGFNVIWFQINAGEIQGLLRIFITLNLIFLIISLGLGIWSVLRMHIFMNKAGDYYQERSEKMNKYIIDTGRTSGAKYPEYVLEDKEIKLQARFWQHDIQIGFLFLGIIDSLIITLWFLWY